MHTTDNTNIKTIIRDNVKYYMKINKVKRKSLETNLGVKTVDNILKAKGKYGITIVTLEKLSKLLSVKSLDLIEEW